MPATKMFRNLQHYLYERFQPIGREITEHKDSLLGLTALASSSLAMYATGHADKTYHLLLGYGVAETARRFVTSKFFGLKSYVITKMHPNNIRVNQTLYTIGAALYWEMVESIPYITNLLREFTGIVGLAPLENIADIMITVAGGAISVGGRCREENRICKNYEETLLSEIKEHADKLRVPVVPQPEKAISQHLETLSLDKFDSRGKILDNLETFIGLQKEKIILNNHYQSRIWTSFLLWLGAAPLSTAVLYETLKSDPIVSLIVGSGVGMTVVGASLFNLEDTHKKAYGESLAELGIDEEAYKTILEKVETKI